MLINSKIGSQILKRRKELGWTQEELAIKMGYKTKSSINKIENGNSDIPQSKVMKFAEVLDTTPGYLMGWDTDVIDAASELFSDKNAYSDSKEKLIQEFMYEINEMNLQPHVLEGIRNYAHMLNEDPRNASERIILLAQLYSLQLSIDELQETINYAHFIRSKRKDD